MVVVDSVCIFQLPAVARVGRITVWFWVQIELGTLRCKVLKSASFWLESVPRGWESQVPLFGLNQEGSFQGRERDDLLGYVSWTGPSSSSLDCT